MYVAIAIYALWHIYVARAIYAILAHICRENDLRAPSGKFLPVKFCRPERFDFLCLCKTAQKSVYVITNKTQGT